MGAGHPVGPDGVFVSPRNVGPVLYKMTPGSFDHASRLNSPAGVNNASRTSAATPATSGGARLGFTPSSAMSSRRGAPDSASSARSGAVGVAAASSALNSPNHHGTPAYRVLVTPAQQPQPGSNARGSVNARYPAAGSRVSMAASPSPIRSPARSPVRSPVAPSSSAATIAAATAVLSSPKLTGMFDASPIHPYPSAASTSAASRARSPSSPRFTTREDVLRMQRSRSASPAAVAPRPLSGRASPNGITPAAASRASTTEPYSLRTSPAMAAALAARSAAASQATRAASQSVSPVRGSIYSRPLSAVVVPALPSPSSAVASPQRALSSSRSTARQTDALVESWVEEVSTARGILSLNVRRSSSLRQLHRFALFTLHSRSHQLQQQQPIESLLHSLTESFVAREFSEAASRHTGVSLAFHALKAHDDPSGTADRFTLVMVFDTDRLTQPPQTQMHEWIGKFVAAMGSVAAECSFIELRPAHWR